MLYAFAFLLLQGSSTAPVVINEFAYDDTGTDSHEFVELYNRSGAPVDISGWTVDCGDATACAGVCTTPGCLALNNNADFTIPPATILPAGGYWVIGMAPVTNVNQVTALTLENDEEWITLRDAGGVLVDTLAYETNKIESCFPTATAAEGPGIYGNNVMTEFTVNPPFARLAVSRVPDGFDTNNNGRDFFLAPATPGASNTLAVTVPYVEDFDALPVGLEPAGLTGSFVNPRVIDPATVDGFNPGAIAPSPQGGNALSLWDPAGGGNATVLTTAASDRIDLECYVYLDTTNLPPTASPGEYETFSIGLQGTTDAFANHPNPAGVLSTAGVTGLAEPNTGIAWEFVAFTDLNSGLTTAVLALVDENDGGLDNTTLGSVTITPGANDGWQRLRLRVNGSRVDGWFGGPLGTTEGTHFSGTLANPGPGTVYFGYREFVTANTSARPLTIDALTVRPAEAGVDFVTPPAPCFGSLGCAPSIGWSGGNASVSAPGPFSIDLSRATSPAPALLVIGVVNTGLFPLDLGLLFPPASAPCYLLQDFPILLSLATAGGGPCVGTTSVAFPNLAGAAVGGTVYTQYAVVDIGSPLGFPVVASDGLAITFQP